MNRLIFSYHAAQRWFERFPKTDYQKTIRVMRLVEKKPRAIKIYKGNGVTLITRAGTVITVL